MVRNFIGFLLFCILVFTTSAYPFTGSSFRLASTGRLLEDDFDLLFDPARIPEIKGERLYTSLSNFVDQNEEVFSNTDNGFFLIGGSTDSEKNRYGGLVFDRLIDETPQFTGLFDRNGNPLFGMGEREDVTFFDDDGNNIYDRKSLFQETREARTEETAKDFFLGLARYFGDTRFGIGWEHNEGRTDTIRSGDNFTFRNEETNLITGDLLLTDDEIGTGFVRDKFNSNTLLLSYWFFAGQDLDVGLRVGVTPFSSQDMEWWDEVQMTNRSPTDPSIDSYNRFESFTDSVPTKGLGIRGGGTGFYDWNETVQTRVFLNIFTSSFDIKEGARLETIFQDADTLTLGGDYVVSSNNNSTTGPITGDGSSQSLDLFTYTWAKLTDDVTFAIGIRGTGTTRDETRITDQSTVEVFSYNDGDGVPEFADSTVTVTSSQVVEEKTSSSVNQLSVPVGIEFKIKKPVFLRLGAIHTETFTDRTTNDVQTEYSESLRHAEYGDGTFSDDLVDPSFQIPGTSETTESRSSETVYTYGLGIFVSKNLQIDLMGFSDLTDLSNWKLSAILKFD